MKTTTREVQTDLFGLPTTEPAVPSRRRAAQTENLERVRGAIGSAVLSFCQTRIGREFHAQELRDAVAKVHPTAPASADRILRDLRQRGYVEYTLMSRAQSLYKIVSVK